MKLKLIALIGAMVIMVGCSPLEKVAYQTVVGAKAFTDSVKKIHPECATATSTVCTDVAKAVSAKDALIDAAEAYCSGADFETGGVCNPPTKGTPASAQAIAKLKAAIATYAQTEKDVKGVL